MKTKANKGLFCMIWILKCCASFKICICIAILFEALFYCLVFRCWFNKQERIVSCLLNKTKQVQFFGKRANITSRTKDRKWKENAGNLFTNCAS